MEKYRDNVRAALDALKKQHPDAEKHSNGYRQIEMQVKQGIREVEDSMLAAPPAYKPPLQLVRQDLITMDELKGRLVRSEEHTSELQSRLHLVCRLLLEK